MTNIQSGYLKTKNGVQLMTTVPYPIGAIYLSVDSINPNKLFGGTWQQIAQGRTLVGVDTSQTEFNTVKKTGGSKYLQRHYHFIAGSGASTNTGDLDANHSVAYWASNGASDLPYSLRNAPDGATKGITSISGTGDSGNLQPYYTCYIWLRTA